MILLVGTLSACAAQDDEAPSNGLSLVDRVRSEGELVVAVPYEGRPPEGEFNPSLTTYTGFEVELAREVAESLGVELRFAPSPSAAKSRLTAEDEIDISFPQTFKVPAEVLATRPYLQSEVRLLTRKGSGIDRAGGLGSGEACAIGGLPPETDSIQQGTSSPQRCLHRLIIGKVDAVIGYDVTLGGLAAENGEPLVIAGPPLATAPLNAVVAPGGDDLVSHINGVIERAEEEGLTELWRRNWVERFEE